MKKTIVTFILLFPVFLFGQDEIPESADNAEPVRFHIIENIPIFPGCEEVERKDRLDCFNDKMSKHITENFRYPEKALKRKIQGRVFVMFVINKEGEVEDVVTRGADPILQTEARRIFSLLPKFQPGTQRGKAVNVRYSMPLNFKLQ